MKKYTIKRGKHGAKGVNFGIMFKKTITFKCKFDKSCLYEIDGVDKYDINKLFGFSTTWFHHIQSARIGWRCIDGENIEIVTYSYNDKKRDLGEADILGFVKPNEEFVCSITDNEDHYLYTFYKSNKPQEIIIFTDKKKKDWFIFHYFLFPFFGGNKFSPHTMHLYLEIIK